MVRETVVSRLKKVQALVENGSPGEREAAEFALAKLLDKYDISPEELLEEEAKTVYWFKFKCIPEIKIYFSVCHMVLDAESISYYRGKKRCMVGVELTRAQKVEIDSLSEFYIEEYRKELASIKKNLHIAFIRRNEIGTEQRAENDSNVKRSKKKEMSYEDIIRIRNLMSSHEKIQRPRKMIKNENS